MQHVVAVVDVEEARPCSSSSSKRREVRHESASYGFMGRLELRIAVRGMDLLFGSAGWLLASVFVWGPALKYHYNLLLDVSYTSDAGPFDSSKVEFASSQKHTLLRTNLLF
jgi:hypothetical protein